MDGWCGPGNANPYSRATASGYRYIKGTNSTKPADAAKVSDWVETNDHIVGTLCQVVNNSLAQGIENLMNAHDAWERLKSKTYQSGIISKFNTLQNAM